jgi:hypothetical protein
VKSERFLLVPNDNYDGGYNGSYSYSGGYSSGSYSLNGSSSGMYFNSPMDMYFAGSNDSSEVLTRRIRQADRRVPTRPVEHRVRILTIRIHRVPLRMVLRIHTPTVPTVPIRTHRVHTRTARMVPAMIKS